MNNLTRDNEKKLQAILSQYPQLRKLSDLVKRQAYCLRKAQLLLEKQ